MSKRSWVLIPVTHTRLILFTIFGVKIVLVFDEKTKINETKDPLHRESNSSRLFLKQEDSNKVSVTRFGYFWKVLTSNFLRKLGDFYVFLIRMVGEDETTELWRPPGYVNVYVSKRNF